MAGLPQLLKPSKFLNDFCNWGKNNWRWSSGSQFASWKVRQILLIRADEGLGQTQPSDKRNPQITPSPTLSACIGGFSVMKPNLVQRKCGHYCWKLAICCLRSIDMHLNSCSVRSLFFQMHWLPMRLLWWLGPSLIIAAWNYDSKMMIGKKHHAVSCYARLQSDSVCETFSLTWKSFHSLLHLHATWWISFQLTGESHQSDSLLLVIVEKMGCQSVLCALTFIL